MNRKKIGSVILGFALVLSMSIAVPCSAQSRFSDLLSQSETEASEERLSEGNTDAVEEESADEAEEKEEYIAKVKQDLVFDMAGLMTEEELADTEAACEAFQEKTGFACYVISAQRIGLTQSFNDYTDLISSALKINQGIMVCYTVKDGVVGVKYYGDAKGSFTSEAKEAALAQSVGANRSYSANVIDLLKILEEDYEE